jgi:hypothetical protein
MTRFRHPRELKDRYPDEPPGVAVDVDGETVTPDGDGVYEHEAATVAWLERFAASHGVDADAIRVGGDGEDTEICGADLSDGGTCDRPAGECPYHSEGE